MQIAGDFDDAMERVKEVSQELGIYLVNSVNPFRLEGQKTIMYRVLEALRWQVPDWIVVPGGNLGNSSAFGKAFSELFELGLIDRIPRLAVINARERARCTSCSSSAVCAGIRDLPTWRSCAAITLNWMSSILKRRRSPVRSNSIAPSICENA